jgi:hypothetical protein
LILFTFLFCLDRSLLCNLLLFGAYTSHVRWEDGDTIWICGLFVRLVGLIFVN